MNPRLEDLIRQAQLLTAHTRHVCQDASWLCRQLRVTQTAMQASWALWDIRRAFTAAQHSEVPPAS